MTGGDNAKTPTKVGEVSSQMGHLQDKLDRLGDSIQALYVNFEAVLNDTTPTTQTERPEQPHMPKFAADLYKFNIRLDDYNDALMDMIRRCEL